MLLHACRVMLSLLIDWTSCIVIYRCVRCIAAIAPALWCCRWWAGSLVLSARTKTFCLLEILLRQQPPPPATTTQTTITSCITPTRHSSTTTASQHPPPPTPQCLAPAQPPHPRASSPHLHPPPTRLAATAKSHTRQRLLLRRRSTRASRPATSRRLSCSSSIRQWGTARCSAPCRRTLRSGRGLGAAGGGGGGGGGGGSRGKGI